MGRGLSKLQRWILEQARERGRLYQSDVCADYFGWPRRTEERGRQQFSREEIGPEEYDRVRATVSRSCRRLEERGLVRRFDGYSIGSAGVEPADEEDGDE